MTFLGEQPRALLFPILMSNFNRSDLGSRGHTRPLPWLGPGGRAKSAKQKMVLVMTF